MKTRKKFSKNQAILNRNIYINFYSNYLIYSYLNNYNLKFFFYFLLKKKYYLRNKKKIICLTTLDVRNKYTLLNNQFKFLNTNLAKISTKDKFFQTPQTAKTNYSFVNKQISLLSNSVNNKSSNSSIFMVSKNFNYIGLNNNSTQIYRLMLIYKEVLAILFILNLVKLFEVYKVILNLVYLNIKI